MNWMILAALVTALYMLIQGAWKGGRWMDEIIEKYESLKRPRDGALLYFFYLVFKSNELTWREKLTGLGKFSPSIVGLIILVFIVLAS